MVREKQQHAAAQPEESNLNLADCGLLPAVACAVSSIGTFEQGGTKVYIGGEKKLLLLAVVAYYGGPAAVLRGGLHPESLPGHQPAQRPSPAHHAEGRGKLPTVTKLLQVCSERNCT